MRTHFELMRKSHNSGAKVIHSPCVSTGAQFQTQQFASYNASLYMIDVRIVYLQHGGGNYCRQKTSLSTFFVNLYP